MLKLFDTVHMKWIFNGFFFSDAILKRWPFLSINFKFQHFCFCFCFLFILVEIFFWKNKAVKIVQGLLPNCPILAIAILFYFCCLRDLQISVPSKCFFHSFCTSDCIGLSGISVMSYALVKNHLNPVYIYSL